MLYGQLFDVLIKLYTSVGGIQWRVKSIHYTVLHCRVQSVASMRAGVTHLSCPTKPEAVTPTPNTVTSCDSNTVTIPANLTGTPTPNIDTSCGSNTVTIPANLIVTPTQSVSLQILL